MAKISKFYGSICKNCGEVFHSPARSRRNKLVKPPRFCPKCRRANLKTKRKNLFACKQNAGFICPICPKKITYGMRQFNEHFACIHGRSPTEGEIHQAQNHSSSNSRSGKAAGIKPLKRTDAMFRVVSGSYGLGKKK